MRALVLLALLGCGKNPAVVASEAMAEAVCACPDKPCADEAHKRGLEEAMKHTGRRGTRADEERIRAAGARVQACLANLSGK
jgi:hypothetical protein